MARRGRFGRRRRGGGNLTALIASLLREQRAARDRAIFDAYNNGGQFEGKPVTDKRILDYITERRNGFSKDDPLWDEWNNRLIQSKFSIGESKIQLRFQQGKVGAGAVAAFYRREMARLPQDSAFYREVAGRAAQWAKAAGAAARGRARGTARAALNKALAPTELFKAQYEFITTVLENEAKRRGLIEGNDKLHDADASDLTDMMNSISAIPMIVNGKPVDVPWSFDEWRKWDLKRADAYKTEILLKEKAGYTTKDLRKQWSRFVNEVIPKNNAIDDRAKFETALDRYLDAKANAHGDPTEILRATSDFLKAAGTIVSIADKRGDNDPEFIGAATKLIDALATGDASKVLDDSPDAFGYGLPEPIDDLAADVKAASKAAEDLAAGKAYYGQGEYGGEFSVHQYPPASPADLFATTGLSENQTQAIMDVNGRPMKVVLAGQEIKTAFLVKTERTKDGKAVDIPVDPASINPDEVRKGLVNGTFRIEEPETGQRVVGYTYRNPVNGEQSWGIYDENGKLRFTSTNPFTTALVGGVLLVSATPEIAPGTRDVVGYRPNIAASLDADSLSTGSPLLVGNEVDDAMLKKAVLSINPETGENELGLDPGQAVEFTNYLTQRSNNILSQFAVGRRDPLTMTSVESGLDEEMDMLSDAQRRAREDRLEAAGDLAERSFTQLPPPAFDREMTPVPSIKVPSLTTPKPPGAQDTSPLLTPAIQANADRMRQITAITTASGRRDPTNWRPPKPPVVRQPDYTTKSGDILR